MQERQQQQQQQQTNGFSEIKSKDEIDRVVINDCFKKGQAPPPPPVCLENFLFIFSNYFLSLKKSLLMQIRVRGSSCVSYEFFFIIVFVVRFKL